MPLLRHIFEETHPVCRKKVEFSGNVSSEEEEEEEEGFIRYGFNFSVGRL